MPDAVQTAMVDLQLHYEASAMAFSGSILTVQDVEKCVMDHILPNRPVEVRFLISSLPPSSYY